MMILRRIYWTRLSTMIAYLLCMILLFRGLYLCINALLLMSSIVLFDGLLKILISFIGILIVISAFIMVEWE